MSVEDLAKYLPLVRIFLGWFGASLVGAGYLSPEVNETLQGDPILHDIGLMLLGSIFLLVQLVWWRIARIMDWQR